jgi:hypothetical protein
MQFNRQKIINRFRGWELFFITIVSHHLFDNIWGCFLSGESNRYKFLITLQFIGHLLFATRFSCQLWHK